MQSRRRVLIVDDEPNDAYLLIEAFAELGLPHELSTVTDGLEAIRYLAGDTPYADRVQYPLPDLVLLDIKMPRATGFKVLDWVRSCPELCTLPVVMLSSSAHPDDLQRARSLGANQYKVKPGSFRQLVALVDELDRVWLRRPAPASPATPADVKEHSRRRPE